MPHRRRNYAEERARSKREREAMHGIGPSLLGAADGVMAAAFKLLLFMVVFAIVAMAFG